MWVKSAAKIYKIYERDLRKGVSFRTDFIDRLFSRLSLRLYKRELIFIQTSIPAVLNFGNSFLCATKRSLELLKENVVPTCY